MPLFAILRIHRLSSYCIVFRVLNVVVAKVGKLAMHWDMPLYSMSAMDPELRDPSNYGTLVRVSTTSDRFATALLMFCQHNDVCANMLFVSS